MRRVVVASSDKAYGIHDELPYRETAPLDKGAVALVTVTLKKCPTCDSHHMDFSLQHSTVDKRVARASLLTVDKPQAAAA